MKQKFWNWVKNEGALEERTLFLNGEISDETWYGDEVTPKLFSDELNAGNGNITVWINSPGGDVFAAAQIYNMLRAYKGKVTVRIDSLAASAASVIAMAGDTVEMSPVAMMMIHNPSTIAAGNTADMQAAIGMLNEVKEAILNAYEGKTGMRRNKLATMMDEETWINAKKALELGFCDRILFSDGVVEAKEEPEVEEQSEDKGTEPNFTLKAVYPFPLTSMMYSRKSVENSFISKVAAETPEEGVSIERLRERLNLIAH